jgi:transposase-like protein
MEHPMTRQPDCTLSDTLVDLIADQGLEALPELIRIIINTAMQAERQQYLNAAPYERTEERRGYANGFKPKTVTTRMGKIAFAVPQVRDGSFYPHALEKGLRSERALTLALAEMYVQGVSTRKVAAITEQLCGVELSSMQVSRAAAQLDEVLERWRTRPLGVTPYVLLDARYEKVRIDGQVRDAAVLLAMGITADGKRTILGVSVAVSEQEVHWRQFLQGLLARGLSGVQLITSDAHTGLQAARAASFGGVPWQRCQFHLQQNAQAYVPRQDMKAEVAADIRAIFTAANWIEADALLSRTIQKYAKIASKLATWMESALREGLTIFSLPAAHRQRLRTVNGLERFNQEIRRRTRVVGVFPNEASCLRLVSALAMETSDEWETGKIYLSLIG